ncbi:hypothetical protein [Paracoccus sp. KR1-242]|uniref:hypothetical protein n=1 Tax=Paracoccus sp. KR1-242 TaxID=3410028 RepID=UPI003C025261
MVNALISALKITVLLAVLYAAAFIHGSLAVLLLLAAIVLAAVSIIRPIPSFGLPTRRFGLVALITVSLLGLSIVGKAARREKEEHLAALKLSDPAAYLSEIEQDGDQNRWLNELATLAPEQFAAETARIESEKAEQAEYTARMAAVEAERRATQKQVADALKSREEAREREYGFHCLSTWDGSHAAFKKAVKSALRAPDSFEHVETATFPVSAGRNRIVMTYRGQNGFGGTNVERAIGSFDNSTCNARVEMIE